MLPTTVPTFGAVRLATWPSVCPWQGGDFGALSEANTLSGFVDSQPRSSCPAKGEVGKASCDPEHNVGRGLTNSGMGGAMV